MVLFLFCPYATYKIHYHLKTLKCFCLRTVLTLPEGTGIDTPGIPEGNPGISVFFAPFSEIKAGIIMQLKMEYLTLSLSNMYLYHPYGLLSLLLKFQSVGISGFNLQEREAFAYE